jgi:hypothetical protein
VPFHSVASYRQIIVCERLILALLGNSNKYGVRRAQGTWSD